MTRILIIGGGGMIGQKLARSLATEGFAGANAPEVTLFDRAFPAKTAAPAAQIVPGDVTNPGQLARLAAARPDIVFHLASIVSGESETNFDLGWSVNHMAFWQFLEALRAEHLKSDGAYRPRVVFTSSIAAYGGPYPDEIPDDFPLHPQTSYGTQKVIAEMMLNDVSRKGFVDGLSIRLPTICVRPGKANLAASSFFSGIIREPLNGKEAVLPVSRDVRHWHASPRSAVGFLRHAASLDTAALGDRRALVMPGVSCTVGEQIEALRDRAGEDVVKLIREERDPFIERIVAGWPTNFAASRARELGFTAEDDFGQIIDTYMAEDREAP